MGQGNNTYIVYVFFSVDDKGNHEFFAVMPERRGIHRRTRESIFKWGRMAVCDPYKVKRIYYVSKVLPRNPKTIQNFIGELPEVIPKRNSEGAYKGGIKVPDSLKEMATNSPQEVPPLPKEWIWCLLKSSWRK